MFFDNWSGLARVVVIGILAYASLVVILRASGKRTLSKMSAFDLVVTVSLGSTLATVLLSKDIPLFEGLLAFAILAGLQYAVAWASVRSELIRRAAKSNPRLILTDGILDEYALTEERVTRQEVFAAIRGSGYGDTADIAGVILETDGSFSVVPLTQAGQRSAFP